MNILETDAVYKILDYLDFFDFLELRLVSKSVKSKVDNVLLKYISPIINKRNGLLKWFQTDFNDVEGVKQKNNIVLTQCKLKFFDIEKSRLLYDISYHKKRKIREERHVEEFNWKKRKLEKICEKVNDICYKCFDRYGRVSVDEFNTVYRNVRKRIRRYATKEAKSLKYLRDFDDVVSQKRRRIEEIKEQKAKTLLGVRSFSRKIKRRKKN